MTELDARISSGTVRAVRHTFEPSSSLKQELETFVGPAVESHFVLHATKRIYLDSRAYHSGKHIDQDYAVHEAVKHVKHDDFIIERIGTQALFRSRFDAQDEDALADKFILELHPHRRQMREFTKVLAQLDRYKPRVMQDKMPPAPYLFMELKGADARALGDRAMRALRVEQLKNTIEGASNPRLYSASVSGIGSVDVATPKLH